MRARKIASVALIVAAMTIGPVSAASATAATAYNEKYQYLTDNPTSDMETSCVERNIKLAAGNYIWQLDSSFVAESQGPTIKLRAGSYDWEDCLVPETSSIPNQRGDYVHTSYLQPLSFSGSTATLKNIDFQGVPNWTTWGSDLEPQF
jgi:hypothetical protein